jgi:large subunit ribosomal protein L4
MKCAVTTLENKSAGEIDLADDVFGLPMRRDILARAVQWQLANRRAGTHKVKGRSEVAGSNAKRYRQKGTGRARIGAGRGAQFRGGGRAFGPVLRDHAQALNKKVRKLALKTALSAKLADGKLIVLEAAKTAEPKTADLAKKFAALGWSSALVIDGPELDGNFARAARNLRGVDVLPQQGANVHDILRCDTLVLTKNAIEALEARLK